MNSNHPYFGDIRARDFAAPSGTAIDVIRKEIARAVFLFSLPLFLNGFYNPYLALFPNAFWFVEILTWIVLPFYLLKRLHSKGVLAPYLKAPSIPIRRRIALAIVFSPLLWGLLRGADWVLKHSLPGYFIENLFFYNEVVPEAGPGKLFASLFLSLTAAIWEEIFFRLLPFRLFKSNQRYVIYSSLLFAVLHFEQNVGGMLDVLLYALLSAGLFAKFRQILPLMIAHFFIDFLLFYFGV